MSVRRYALGLTAALATVSLAPPALAHPGHGVVGGPPLIAGLLHPLTGIDHLLALFTLGLVAGFWEGSRAPALAGGLVAGLAAGIAAGLAGFIMPLVEPMILASIVLAGVVLALVARIPAELAAAAGGLFGLAHGYAHGVEAPAGGEVLFIAGFGATTLGLAGAGFLVGRALRSRGQMLLLRGTGLAAMTAGLLLALR